MRRKSESPVEILVKLPWWVSAAIGGVAFIILRWGLPIWAGDDAGKKALIGGFVGLAPVLLFTFGILAAVSFWFGRHRGRLIDEQTSLESIRATPWKQFEFLVAEAYRRQGYQVDFSLGQGADGGVDLVLRKAGRTSLVQCKQWKTVSVGAPVIREMFGLMTAEQASETIIVTSGNFTRDAQSFAEGKPIRLVDGPQLLSLVRSVQSAPASPGITPATGPRQPEPPPSPTCPQCGKTMILRTARRGKNAGNQFWGCPAYPDCSGTRTI